MVLVLPAMPTKLRSTGGWECRRTFLYLRKSNQMRHGRGVVAWASTSNFCRQKKPGLPGSGQESFGICIHVFWIIHGSDPLQGRVGIALATLPSKLCTTELPHEGPWFFGEICGRKGVLVLAGLEIR